MIPNLLHVIWVDSPLPDWAAENARAFIETNPGLTVTIHTDDEHLHPDYRTAWEAAIFPSVRADVLRYSLLERFGGLYCDLDVRPLRPLAGLPELTNLGEGLLIAPDANADMSHVSVNNWFLAAGTECTVWPTIREYVKATAIPQSPCDLAIGMLERLVRRCPEYFRVGRLEHFTSGTRRDRWYYENPLEPGTQYLAHAHNSVGRRQVHAIM